MWHVGLVALRCMGSSFLSQELNHVPCVESWILNHWTTGEVAGISFKEDIPGLAGLSQPHLHLLQKMKTAATVAVATPLLTVCWAQRKQHWVHSGVRSAVTLLSSVQFSSVTQLCLTLCNPMNRSRPGLPVHHQLPESTQTHVHCVSDAIQPSHPLSSPSPPALDLSQHQGLF